MPKSCCSPKTIVTGPLTGQKNKLWILSGSACLLGLASFLWGRTSADMAAELLLLLLNERAEWRAVFLQEA